MNDISLPGPRSAIPGLPRFLRKRDLYWEGEGLSFFLMGYDLFYFLITAAIFGATQVSDHTVIFIVGQTITFILVVFLACRLWDRAEARYQAYIDNYHRKLDMIDEKVLLKWKDSLLAQNDSLTANVLDINLARRNERPAPTEQRGPSTASRDLHTVLTERNSSPK